MYSFPSEIEAIIFEMRINFRLIQCKAKRRKYSVFIIRRWEIIKKSLERNILLNTISYSEKYLLKLISARPLRKIIDMHASAGWFWVRFVEEENGN